VIQSLDSTGLDYLLVSDPFIYDAIGGGTYPLAHDSIDITTVPPEITVNIPAAVYDTLVATDFVGFTTVLVPPGATADTSRLTDGRPVPYTVDLEAADGSIVTYTVDINRSVSTGYGIAGIEADINYQYTETDYDRYLLDASHWNSWKTNPNNWVGDYQGRISPVQEYTGDRYTNPLPDGKDGRPLTFYWFQQYGNRYPYGVSYYLSNATSGIWPPDYLSPNDVVVLNETRHLVNATIPLSAVWTNTVNPPDIAPVISNVNRQSFFQYGYYTLWDPNGTTLVTGADYFRRPVRVRAWYNYEVDETTEYREDYDWVDIQTIFVHLEPYTDINPSDVTLFSTADSFQITGTHAGGKTVEITMKDNPTFNKTNTIGQYAQVTFRNELHRDTGGLEGEEQTVILEIR
jgi:hypothetical protein